MEEIINMPVDKLYSKAFEFKQINDYNNYYMYMTMAANHGHPETISCLIEDYYQDGNLLQDHIVTFPFYEQTKNFSYSSNYLACMYRDGYGVEQNLQKAIEFYMHAIRKENIIAMHHLARIYKNGYGVEKNYQKAIELYTLAIEKGREYSMNNLAKKNMYQNSDRLEQNYQKAIESYTRAIEKRRGSSMNNLAIMYENGNGVEQNYQKAIELYKQAIEKESMHALKNLTTLYRDHQSLFNRKDIIDFFLFKYPDNLETIFNYDSDMISCLQENHELKKCLLENQELKKINKELIDHINFSPGGTEYFEIVNEWKNKLQCGSL